jgi:tight adherence protein C
VTVLGALVAGAVFGTGLLLMVRGLCPPRPALTAALTELARPRPEAEPLAGRNWDRSFANAAVVVTRWLRREPPASQTQDLALIGRSPERHAVDKLAYATLGLGLPVGFAVVAASGGVNLAPALVGVASLGGAAAGFVYPDIALRTEAAARRREFRHALASYLDLVTIILAGGGGVESALNAAADTGDGWVFARIRRALAVSRLNRESPWAVLNRMADDVAIPELAELASSIGLAGDSGAKVRRSLTAKATSMRDHEMADAHAAAETASERMAAPVVVMLTGFILLIGYPAMANVLTL